LKQHVPGVDPDWPRHTPPEAQGQVRYPPASSGKIGVVLQGAPDWPLV